MANEPAAENPPSTSVPAEQPPATQNTPPTAEQNATDGPDIAVTAAKHKFGILPALGRVLLAPVKAAINGAVDAVKGAVHLPGDVLHLAGDIVTGKPIIPAALKVASDVAAIKSVGLAATPAGAVGAALAQTNKELQAPGKYYAALAAKQAEANAVEVADATPPEQSPSKDPEALKAALANAGGALAVASVARPDAEHQQVAPKNTSGMSSPSAAVAL